MTPEQAREQWLGGVYAFSAYLLWGFLPMYFVLLAPTGPFEVVGWRIVLSFAFCLLLLTVTPEFSYWTQVLPSVLVFSLGLTITVAPLTSAILGAIEPERSGIASAVNNAVARIAGLVVIAMLAGILGGSLDLDGFHRAALVTAAMMIAGGVISFLGIRNTAPVTTSPVPTS